MTGSRLQDHLLRDHGRTGPDIDGLPLADLHRLEHVEHGMGLITLTHRHAPDGAVDGGLPPRAG
jgi:hypothetical protein